MTLVGRTMAAGIAAAGVTASESAGQQVRRDGKTAEQFKLALAEA